ncbi:3-oxoacyl-ACP synthase III family protein [Geothrix fuzhouensis]|uniref:3-oxoacyl-ACP synthase III family protein n=1 Tax=Geothrix fuzhouensis TaxID=2966451 RepID=UPI0021494368|nr:3-oxoacyl-[acyl-carrier-protein] synthase III C-terminal domain-containing protein [Geothrix fuzhouensis]
MAQVRSVITGTGSCLPLRHIPNDAFLEHAFFEGEGQPYPAGETARMVAKFQEITEIAERRYVSEDRVASDLALDAAEKALASAAIDPETLDYLIVAHNFGDVTEGSRQCDQVPTLAARVKARLRIANPFCVAYDLPFGCPGWLQAMIQADYFLRSGDAKRALVIGAETLSRVSDPCDRDSLIYADGAGAVVLEAQAHDEPVGILAHATRTDTLDHGGLLRMGRSFDLDRNDGQLYIKMQGRKLYEYAIATVPGLVRLSLERAGLSLEQVDKVLIHQANGKMDEAILKRLFRLYGMTEMPAGIMPMTVSWLGNSSVATVPTLLDLVVRGQMEGHTLNSGDHVVFASVGAGMSINAMVYRWPSQR